jgi:hypothetical protein
MVTALEGCATEEQRSVVQFFVGKRTQCKDIHNEMFPVYGGKCLSREVIHNWVQKFSQGRSKVADDAWPGAEVDVTTVKRFLCCGF